MGSSGQDIERLLDDRSLAALQFVRHRTMIADAAVAPVAALVADRTRAAMLQALGDGRALPACDLALQGGVKAPTASAHLAKLVEGGLLRVERQGRHAVYRLASPQVARLLEALATLARPVPPGTFREARHGRDLRLARSCYDHLAGRLGVAVTEALVRAGGLRARGNTFVLGARGARALARLGVDVDAARAGRRAFARPCLDWSERRHHLAGALGAALLDRLLDSGWLERRPSGRALVVTERGWRGLQAALAVERIRD
jgi:DNA-binding transcriptional ArsR family regulator